MARTSSSHEFFKFLWVIGVWLADNNCFTLVAIISNHSMPWRDHVLQTSTSKDCDIMSTGLEWTVHPHKLVLVRRNAQFIIQPRLIEFVGVVGWVFRLSCMLRFLNSTMYTIDTEQKRGNERETRRPIFWPDNLSTAGQHDGQTDSNVQRTAM